MAAASRAALDAGSAERIAVARRLASFARELLRRAPTDVELIAAVGHLAARGFTPPHPAVLPEGGTRDVWTALSSRAPDERAALAATIVALPDPAADPDLAARTMELLLSVPTERERARRLLERTSGHVPPETSALWRLRLDAAALDPDARADAATWPPLLAALRALGDEGAAQLATGLRMAASALLESIDAPGTEWLGACLDGRRVANLRPALLRRPALAPALGPALDWLEEAARIEAVPEVDEVEGALARAESADDIGDFAGATALIEHALARSGGRPDLVEALVARCELLQDGSLATRLAGLDGAEELDPQRVRRTAARELRASTVTPPPAPERGWSHLIRDARHDHDGSGVPSPEQLGFLEVAGSSAAAAYGWLYRGQDSDLLQAVRLAPHLDEGARSLLTSSLMARAPDDEQVLAADEGAMGLAAALWSQLLPGEERTVWALRLRAASPDDPSASAAAAAPGSEAEPAADDPHRAASRLAAAADLLDAGRPDAAATIVVAVLRKFEDLSVLPELLALSLRLLQMESPPEGIVATTERALLADGPLGDALISALRDDALAAFPLHAALHRAALDKRRPDLLRVRLLEAWLGIWRATATPPDAHSLTDLMHGDVGLLPLAAARLGDAPDPVAAARDFLVRFPPLSTLAGTYGAALLELATPG
ncbi:MAG: hypothetical protein R3F39_04445 [Myxococcota bacterium]